MTQVAENPMVEGDTPQETRAAIVQRARDLFPLLRKNAAEADRNRRLPDENVEALRDAGIWRLWQPKRYGGLETDMRTGIDVAIELSRGCSSTGWVMSLITACSWLTSLFGEDAQDEVFGADPDARVCGVLSPGGTGQRAAGGYVINGSYGFASGSLHSTWTTLVAPLIDEGGNVTNVGMFLIPMTEVTIKDTWFTVGMRGTGSNTIVAENVFVPDHRVRPLLGPTGAMDAPILNPYPNETLYRVDLGPLASLAEIGAPIGIARAALDSALEQLPRRSIAYTTYAHQTEAASTQLELAEAATMIDAAELISDRAAADADTAAANREQLDLTTRAWIRADCGWANKTVRQAVDQIMMMCGASSMAESNYLQQAFRDLTTVSLHALLRPSVMNEVYGRLLCGLDPGITPVL